MRVIPPIITFITEHEKLSYIWISVLIDIFNLAFHRSFKKKKRPVLQTQ